MGTLLLIPVVLLLVLLKKHNPSRPPSPTFFISAVIDRCAYLFISFGTHKVDLRHLHCINVVFGMENITVFDWCSQLPPCIALPPRMYLSAVNDGHGSQFIPFRENLSV